MAGILDKLFIFAIFYNLTWLFVTSGANTGWQSAMADLHAPMPDVNNAKYASWFGTNYVGYFMDWVGAIGTKIADVFVGAWNLFITPSITMYGQTVDMTAIGPLNLAMVGFMAFGFIQLAKGWL